MTLPVSGAISLNSVNIEVGAAGGTPRSLAWVRDNTAYAYKDLNSIHGLTWFQAVSSQNSVSRTVSTTTTNCPGACDSQQDGNCFADFGWGAASGIYGPYIILGNCAAAAAANCNQCGYSHGTYLQGVCNCACNCYVCNCAYNNCVCNCDCG